MRHAGGLIRAARHAVLDRGVRAELMLAARLSAAGYVLGDVGDRWMDAANARLAALRGGAARTPDNDVPSAAQTRWFGVLRRDRDHFVLRATSPKDAARRAGEHLELLEQVEVIDLDHSSVWLMTAAGPERVSGVAAAAAADSLVGDARDAVSRRDGGKE